MHLHTKYFCKYFEIMMMFWCGLCIEKFNIFALEKESKHKKLQL